VYKNRKIKIKIAIFIFGAIIISSALCFGRALAFDDKTTHPALTENIAEVYNANFEIKLSGQEVEWIKKGSVEEDKFPRPANHFFEPNLGIGMAGLANSKSWAQSGSLQKITGDYSWPTALRAYVQGDKEKAFIALGHILHLLEDKAVPAHTRLDEHLTEGDPYEGWAESQKETSFNVAPKIVSQLNEAFDELALYSSKYFLSKDTVNLNKENFNEKLVNNKIYLFSKIGNGKEFKLVEKVFVSNNKAIFIFSDLVNSDYFSLLAPKDVSYGAGVVNLFIQEGERQAEIERNKNWWQKIKDSFSANVGGSLMTGLPLSIVEGIVPAPASQSARARMAEESLSVPVESSPIVLPPNAVEAREKIAVSLPNNTVEAEEKLGGVIEEENVPSEAEEPFLITEESSPEQAILPTPTIVPTPSPSPTATPSSSGSSSSSSTSSSSDTSAPETTIISSPAAAVATTTAVFIFESSKSNSTFMCGLDNATSTVCESPQEYLNLAESSHSFKVSAKDAVGNEDTSPAEYSWSVDLTSPSLTNISSLPTRAAATILWTSSEAGIFQAEYGTTTSYGLLSATTTATNLSLSSLDFGATYHFRILGEDSAGNATTSDDHIFTTSNQAESIVISEVQLAGATAADEFVELYNPTSSDINLLGWRLTKKSATGSTTSNLLTSFPDVLIPAHGYFLISHPTDYDGAVPADAVYSTTSSLADDNTLILYSDAGETVIDLVGLGAAVNFESAAVGNPLDNQSIERLAHSTSTAALLSSGEHKWQGNGYDSNNNLVDFIAQPNPGPQNSLMLTEPRTSWPVLASSVWPTWQGNLFRNGQSNASALATSTMAIKWMATTTATHDFNSRPILDSSGNIYIGRADGLAKYSSSGNLIWLYDSGAIYTVPLIASDGTIYFRGSGALFSINQDGQLKWKYNLSETVASNAAIGILSDGVIITQSSEKVYAINPDATLEWFFDPGRAMITSNAIGSFVIDSADNIYINIDDYIYALNKNGAKIWEKTYGESYSSLAMGTDNTLYVAAASWVSGAFQGGFYALDSANGEIKWSDITGFNNHADWSAAIDSSNKVYPIIFFGGAWVSGRKVQSYNASSTPEWSSSIDSSYLASPIITSDGKIYLADDKTIKTFDAVSGALLGSFSVPDNQTLYNYFGAVGADGIIYTANNTTLYAIDD